MKRLPIFCFSLAASLAIMLLATPFTTLLLAAEAAEAEEGTAKVAAAVPTVPGKEDDQKKDEEKKKDEAAKAEQEQKVAKDAVQAAAEIDAAIEGGTEEGGTDETITATSTESAGSTSDNQAKARQAIEAIGMETAGEESAAVEVTTAHHGAHHVGHNMDQGMNKKPWGVAVGLTHSVGTGSLVQADAIRETADSLSQSWKMGASYKIKVNKEHTLSMKVGFGLNVALTKPTSNPARRVNPSDTSFSVADGKFFKIPVADINVSLSGKLVLPTSYASLNANKRYFALGTALGFSRSFGPIDLSYGLSLSKNFNKYKVSVRSVDPLTIRDTDFINGTNGVVSGRPNVSWGLSNSFSAGYNVSKELAVTYSLVFAQAYTYDISSSADPEGGFSSGLTDSNGDLVAQLGSGRKGDMLIPGLDVSFALSDALTDVVALPFMLNLSAGIAAAHPAQTPDNKKILWPFFYSSFGQGRAANNYGEFYFSLNGMF